MNDYEMMSDCSHYSSEVAMFRKEAEMAKKKVGVFLDLEDYDNLAAKIIALLAERGSTQLEAEQILEYAKKLLKYQKVNPFSA